MNSILQRPPVRVALIGLGRAMFKDHYPVFRDHPSLFKVVAACDTEKKRRDIVAKDFPACKMFRQVEDILDEPDIDLVDIATCTQDHLKHALSSLQRGHWTLIESPMALSYEDAQMLRGASKKENDRLIVMHRGYFSAEFQLAKMMMSDSRLGKIQHIRIRRAEYLRRDDWQALRSCGGGAAWYAMPDLILQVLKLLPMPPAQMWSDLKRIAALGDAEDYAHVCFKTRSIVSADIEYNGGLMLPAGEVPAFEIVGDRGVFTVMNGAHEGRLRCVDPEADLPRRRASVKIPSLDGFKDDLKTIDETIRLPPDTPYGQAGFWKNVYYTIRTAAPYPLAIEDSMETVKFAQLMKKGTPFGGK